MEQIWDGVRGWADAQISHFVNCTFLYSHPDILADLCLPLEGRTTFNRSHYALAIAAESFAKAIEEHRLTAEEFWPEPVETLLVKLQKFSKQLYDRGFALWAFLEDIPTPSHRGPGNRREIAYANAMVHTLESIGFLSRERQDMVIAVLTEVVFGHAEGNEVQPERIRARRKRRRKVIGKGDNCHN
jgi:hypothetical protein